MYNVFYECDHLCFVTKRKGIELVYNKNWFANNTNEWPIS